MKLIYSTLFIIVCSFLSLAQQLPVTWKLETKKINECEYELVFKAKIEKEWHLYSLTRTFGDGAPNPTEFTFKKNSTYELVGKVKESKTKTDYDKDLELTTIYHENEGSFTQRIKVLKAGKVKISGKYSWQTCSHGQCIFPPAENFEFEVEGSPKCATEQLISNDTISKQTNATCACDSQAIVTILSNRKTVLPDSASQKNNKATIVQSDEKKNEDKQVADESWWLVFLNGLGWGLAAVFTPCVFPLIPLNVSFFLKRSGNPKKGRRNAMIYVLSIILIFLLLGTIINSLVDLNSLSTGAPFNLIVFVLLLLFAASFLGAFEIVLPSKFVNKIDQGSEKGGLIGIFFMALTLVVVSFSCTGVMVSNALVLIGNGSSFGGPIIALFGFSLGLALPFGLFALFPSYLSKVPKSGGWLNTIKVTLGFIELALALKFASNVDLVYQLHILTREVFVALWIAIFALLTLYLLGFFKTSHDSPVNFLSVTRIMFATLSLFVTLYLLPGLWGAPLKIFSGVLPPIDYSESQGQTTSFSAPSQTAQTNTKENADMKVSKTGIIHFENEYEKALAYAQKVNKPLLIDFTGRACANCRKTEDFIWTDPRVKSILNEKVVLVSLYVDERIDLPKEEIKTVKWLDKDFEITTVGDKFKFMEFSRYKEIAQPLYIIVDKNEKTLVGPRGYKSSVEEYINWLNEGVEKYNK
ncbi:MAG: thioredoxin family protein [Bacteroidetes bacterium]|nr:thioredoxin family protein [Bacteroidota bacterium]